MTTAYQTLMEACDYITHMELAGKPIDNLNMAMMRMGFMETYLEFLFTSGDLTSKDPIGYPSPEAKIHLHVQLLDQAEKINNALMFTEAPEGFPEHCTAVFDLVGDTLSCHTRADINRLAATYHALMKPALPTQRFPILGNIN